jgi:hypothetical protein
MSHFSRFRAQQDGCERPTNDQFGRGVRNLPVGLQVGLRPLEFYTGVLQQSGFAITSLAEPHPTAEMMKADEWWRTTFTRPLFMLLTAQKTANDRHAARN